MFDEYDNRIVEHNGKTWETDYEGYLLNFDPDEDWYDYVRIKCGIPEITPEHLEILKYCQDYYRKNGIYPFMKQVTSRFRIKNYKYIRKLFPSTDPKYPKNFYTTIMIMAGLPRPWGYK